MAPAPSDSTSAGSADHRVLFIGPKRKKASTTSMPKQDSLEHSTSARNESSNTTEDSNRYKTSSKYSEFTAKVLMDGILPWRMHKHSTDILVMISADLKTGLFKPNGFIHVTRNQSEYIAALAKSMD